MVRSAKENFYQSLSLLNHSNLPWLSIGFHESGIVHGCTHHSWHAWRSIEQIKEWFLCDMIQIHSGYISIFILSRV